MKEMNNNSELDALIDASLDGRLSEEEADRLSKRIEESSEARQRYWELASVHGMIEQSMQSASLKVVTGEALVAPMKPIGLTRWPRITAVAAGMVIGLFSASVVWAYIIPHANRTSKEIVSENFEDPEMKLSGRFPFRANQWFGRVVSVSQEDEMPAVQGTRVGKLDLAPGTRFGYARYVVDLSDYPELADGHARTIEVKASFSAAVSDQSPVFRVGLAAFSQSPEAVQPVWNDRENFNDKVLQEVGRNYIPEPGEQARWHEVSATIEIPPGSRSVVVSLGAGNVKPDKAMSDYYLDAIQVQLVDTFEPQG